MNGLVNRSLRALAFAALLACPAACASQQALSPAAEPLHIIVGKSVVITLETRLKRILLSNPVVIDAFATNPTQLVVEAKAPGTSSLILWDESGASRMMDVTVDLDVSSLRTAIDQAYPDRSVRVEADGERLILRGHVPSQRAEDDLVKMAGIYSKDVVDSLDQPVNHQRQILLEVKVAEVDRTRLQQIGFNFLSTGGGNTIGTISTQQFGPITGSGGSTVQLPPTSGSTSSGSGSTSTTTNSIFGLSDLLDIFIFRPDINFGATIKALEQNQVLQILAEPNLLALSGSKASFLAGGEFPFPVVQGGQNLGVVTIQFQPFGVRLDFVGNISDDNTVRLKVAPEVSSLDFTNAVTISGFTIPAIATRRAETEIELRDGQSFAIGGLLNDQTTALLSKIPGIGDVPILGKLFQSRSIQRSRSELVVLVTPRIVDPVRTGAQMSSVPALAVPSLDTKKYDQELPGHKELEETPPSSPPK
jgi:pilus assembly protein CpaC